MPRPLFDTLDQVLDIYKKSENQNNAIYEWITCCLKDIDLPKELKLKMVSDFKHAFSFLYHYRGSFETFNAYRRDLDRFLQWCWFVKEMSILEIKRLHIEEFVEFCQNPPKHWIGFKMVSRFIKKDGITTPNAEWRPFIAKVSKKAFKDGERPTKMSFTLSEQGIKQIFAILSSFYNALIQDEIVDANPVLQIRQKSKFIRKTSTLATIRRLSDMQWNMVLKATENLAEENPKRHKRTLFMVQMLYGMYLRISELASSKRWQPKMSDFFRDTNGDWWFKTVGKGNKMRQIAVSNKMLKSLKEYRLYLGLSPLPSPGEVYPLIPKERGKGGMESTRVIRNLIQLCFDRAVDDLRSHNEYEEAEMLRSATVHWLRHTGISEDVKHRPREHVRDDAGHSSGAITDRYIDVELKSRARSAKQKTW